jgi:hypothetical protein
LSCKEVQDCRQGINEVQNADVSIVHERDVEVLKELTRHQEFEREIDREEKRGKLINMIEQSDTPENQFMKNLIYYVGITLFLLPAKISKECSRWKLFFLTLFILVMSLLPCVNDNFVFVSDHGEFVT